MDKKGELDPRSVFVRGISFSFGDEQLNAAFSEIGPVRHAFIVKDGPEGRHKGYGFVQYALEEDAERAVQEMHGKDLGGRKLKVEGAKKRASLEERKGKRKQAETTDDKINAQVLEEEPLEQPELKKPRQAVPLPKKKKDVKETLEKHALVRTVAIGGLTLDSVDSAIAFVKKKGQESIEAIIKTAPAEAIRQYKLSQDGCSGDVIFVRYKTTKDAMSAVADLHGQSVNMFGTNSKNKKKTPANSSPSIKLWARQVSGEGMHLKRWRLVIRNLSFKVSEDHLRTAFTAAGFVWEVTMPRDADAKSRGFAFIGFTCRSHAERGIKLINGTKIEGRPVAVDWALSKRDYEQGVSPGAPKEAGGEDDEDFEEEEEEDDKVTKKHVVLGQELGDEEDAIQQIAPEQELGMLRNVIDDILGREDKDDADDHRMEEEESDEYHQEEEEESEESQEKEEEEEEGGGDIFSRKAIENKILEPNSVVERLQKRTEQIAAALGADKSDKIEKKNPGVAVFVRGLALDVTKDQLFTAMRAYGPVYSARLVMDKTTGKPKGTAFVDFKFLQGAEAAVAACNKGKSNAGPGVLVGGKKVVVDLALDGDGARKLAADKGAVQADGKDKRNLYLTKEGIIPEGSAAWNEMSASDKAKRKRAVEEAQTKLRSPNFAVSSTRLNIRNVPRSWDEKKLKSLFIAAVKERATKANPKVVQVKILKEDGQDGTRGQGRSKGIAFVEFADHEHSLCALRQLNNNPKPWGKDTRPIVEFAIDDVRALKKRKERQALPQRTPEEKAAALAAAAEKKQLKKKASKLQQTDSEVQDGDDNEAPKSKRKLRAERRRMLKERQRAAQGRKNSASTVVDDGDVHNTHNAHDAQPSSAITKSQRRREQRKNKKTHEDGGTASKNTPLTTVKLPSKTEKDLAKVNLAQKRKLSADGLIDRLASTGAASAQEGRVVKRRRRDPADKVEKLAEAYVARMYGDDNEGGKKKRKGNSVGKSTEQSLDGRRASKRWFQDDD